MKVIKTKVVVEKEITYDICESILDSNCSEQELAEQIIDDLGNTVASNGIILQQGTYLEITPKDTSICPNSNITLSASGSPNNYNWSAIPVDPTLQFANNDTVSMAPGQTTTYTVSTNDLNVNLVYNGTFELGDQGVMSNYTSFYPNNPSGQQAAYGIINNASF